MGVMKRMATARQMGGRVSRHTGTVIGQKMLDRKLKYLATHGGKKAARAGINAGLTPLVKAMRAAINATDASPALKRQARKTIGKRFAKAKFGATRGRYEAKAGFAVGKKKGRSVKGKSRGVGVGPANVHWFVLGTENRKHKATGQPTGRIANVLGGVTRWAYASAAAPMVLAARAKIAEVIEREALKTH